ncbi:hypothetical protein HT031_005786 [Scenedesmus sp. PABB004]|nr:hypothetical protein HT031_005786 [Scenedesmus sp. PABB004]
MLGSWCSSSRAPCLGAATPARGAARWRCRAAPLPRTAGEVAAWAAGEFRAETAKPDAAVSLARAALLLDLEEAAAARPDGDRTSATASTWSLERLDALAAEVADLLATRDPQALAPPPPRGGGGGAAPRAVRGARFPAAVLSALDAVLARHGYAACARHGAPLDSQLSSVLEGGRGSCAALPILHLEVCARVGLAMGFKVLDGGRYTLVWPRDETSGGGSLLSAGGEACLVDPYGGGALITVKEAAELFAVSESELLAGSTRRELLAALLAELQRAHWCAAVGCSATPLLAVPLTAATAVGQRVRQLQGGSIERAVAAAAKRVALLPRGAVALEAQLQLGLLHYFSGCYEESWIELGAWIEAQRAAGQQPEDGELAHALLLFERLQLELQLAQTVDAAA